jgi:hypothetical protein
MPVDLVERYEQTLAVMIDDDGFPRPPLLALHHDETVTMATMAVPAEQIFQLASDRFIGDLTVKEVIFGVDRFTKPGQGTKYRDVLTVFHWAGEYGEDGGFRFGVVNYRPGSNKIIEPIDWNNAFWNDIMRRIVMSNHERMISRLESIRARRPDLVEQVEQVVKNAGDKARGFKL